MIAISDTAKRIIQGIALQFCIWLAIGWAVIFWWAPFEKPLPFLLGLLLGSAWSAAKVLMMEIGLNRAVDLGNISAEVYSVAQFFLRYLLTAGILIAAALSPWISFWGVAAGLIFLQTAAFACRWLLKEARHGFYK